jgi:hypothetical protein
MDAAGLGDLCKSPLQLTQLEANEQCSKSLRVIQEEEEKEEEGEW